MAYDIFDLYNITDPVEDAAQGVLTALFQVYFSAANVQVVTARQGDIKATPRVELSASLGPPGPQRTAAGQNPSTAKQVPAAYQFTLNALVATTRPVGTNNAAIHGRLVGAVLWGLSAPARPFTDANLPLYQVLELMPAQVGDRVYDKKSQDLTPIAFAGVIAIRNGAWNTPQPPTPPTPGP
jgi:hypothetical protein